MGQLVYIKDVVTLKLDQEKCTGCGMCLLVCPHAVLSLTNGSVKIENRDACMECGACAQNCPSDAVTVNAGVGCATAIINAALGREGDSCCCVIEPKETSNNADTCSKVGKEVYCC
jgi:NAD-dependent dihydropyrimidine dehydrogenase PreA subunit